MPAWPYMHIVLPCKLRKYKFVHENKKFILILLKRAFLYEVYILYHISILRTNSLFVSHEYLWSIRPVVFFPVVIGLFFI